jgi:hypothetical protein
MFCGYFIMFGPPFLLAQGASGCAIILEDCKEDERVLCTLPVFKPIAYKLSISNRRWKYLEEKTTGTLKFKQSSIATVLNHLLTVARFPTPLIFRYPLPLSNLFMKRNFE